MPNEVLTDSNAKRDDVLFRFCMTNGVIKGCFFSWNSLKQLGHDIVYACIMTIKFIATRVLDLIYTYRCLVSHQKVSQREIGIERCFLLPEIMRLDLHASVIQHWLESYGKEHRCRARLRHLWWVQWTNRLHRVLLSFFELRILKMTNLARKVCTFDQN